MANLNAKLAPFVREVATCFDGETLVCTKEGYRRICDIQVGQEVLSRSESTGEQAYQRVVNAFAHRVEVVCQVTINVDGLWEVIFVTSEHPVWVNGEGWMQAGNLHRGQELEICNPDSADPDQSIEAMLAMRLGGKRWAARVESVVRIDKVPRFVYNLEVENFHTYFVGSYGLWVHNKETPSGAPCATCHSI